MSPVHVHTYIEQLSIVSEIQCPIIKVWLKYFHNHHLVYFFLISSSDSLVKVNKLILIISRHTYKITYSMYYIFREFALLYMNMVKRYIFLPNLTFPVDLGPPQGLPRKILRQCFFLNQGIINIQSYKDFT